MSHGLNIRKDAELDFLSLGALVHRLDSGDHSLPQGDRMQDSRQRRRVQCGRQPLRLLWHEDGHRQRDVRLSDRRSDRRARARHGREAFLQALQAQRRDRPQHGHRLQRPRPRPARARGFLQPLQRSGGAAEAGRLRLEGDLCRRRALGPLRRHLRRALAHDRSAGRGDDAGGQGRRRDHLFRSELPREAVEYLTAARRKQSRPSPTSSKTSMSWWATKRTCRRASAFPGRRSRPSPSSIPPSSSA